MNVNQERIYHTGYRSFMLGLNWDRNQYRRWPWTKDYATWGKGWSQAKKDHAARTLTSWWNNYD